MGQLSLVLLWWQQQPSDHGQLEPLQLLVEDQKKNKKTYIMDKDQHELHNLTALHSRIIGEAKGQWVHKKQEKCWKMQQQQVQK